MPEHLTERQFALYIEGQLGKSESRSVRDHLSQCPECAHVLIDTISVADLKTDGLLEEVSLEESKKTERALSSLLKNAAHQTVGTGEAGVSSYSTITVGLWLQAISRMATSSRKEKLPGFALKMLEPIAVGGLAALMPSSAMAMSLGFNLLASSDASLVLMDNAAHAVDRLHGFLVTILAGNVLRLEVTNQKARKVRLRVDDKVVECEVPDSGVVEVNVDTLVTETQSNWLATVAKKKHPEQQGFIMARMEIEILNE